MVYIYYSQYWSNKQDFFEFLDKKVKKYDKNQT